MNIEYSLNKGKNILKKNKIPNPHLDSEILLSKSINKEKKHIILNPKETVDEKQLNTFNDLINRRKKGEPIAYLTNNKNFGNRHILLIKMF